MITGNMSADWVYHQCTKNYSVSLDRQHATRISIIPYIFKGMNWDLLTFTKKDWEILTFYWEGLGTPSILQG